MLPRNGNDELEDLRRENERLKATLSIFEYNLKVRIEDKDKQIETLKLQLQKQARKMPSLSEQILVEQQSKIVVTKADIDNALNDFQLYTKQLFLTLEPYTREELTNNFELIRTIATGVAPFPFLSRTDIRTIEKLHSCIMLTETLQQPNKTPYEKAVDFGFEFVLGRHREKLEMSRTTHWLAKSINVLLAPIKALINIFTGEKSLVTYQSRLGKSVVATSISLWAKNQSIVREKVEMAAKDGEREMKRLEEGKQRHYSAPAR